MVDLIAVAKATRASARALAACQRIARTIGDLQRTGDTRAAAALVPSLCRAQRRYQAAQLILAANPFPGDR